MISVVALAAAGCATGGSADGATSAPASTAAVKAAECSALEDAVTTVTAAHPDGVGLAIGSVPQEEQVSAMRDLVDGLDAVDLTVADLVDLRRAIVVAGQSIIDRAGAEEPLTQDDQNAFAGALAAASSYCNGGTGSPAPTPSVGTSST